MSAPSVTDSQKVARLAGFTEGQSTASVSSTSAHLPYKPSPPSYSPSVVPVPQLNHTRFGDSDARRKLDSQHVDKNATRYGIFPEAKSISGFNIHLAPGFVRTVRVVNIRSSKSSRPIVVEEISSGERWYISPASLGVARQWRVPASGPVVLKRKRE